MEDLPFISVVVPTYNAEGDMERLLESLKGQNYPNKKYEIIVSDDGSKDRTVSIAKDFDVKVIENKNNGPAHARNIGFEKRNEESDIVLFIDSDTKADEDLLLNHVSVHREFDEVIVSGEIEYFGDKTIISKLIEDSSIFPTKSGKNNNLLWSSSNNLSFGVDTFQKLKFDEGFPNAAGEDVDISFRARKKGIKIVHNKDAKVYHKRHSSLISSIKRSYRYGKGTSKLIEKHEEKRTPSLGMISKILVFLFLASIPLLLFLQGNPKILMILVSFYMLEAYFLFVGYVSKKDVYNHGLKFVILLSFLRTFLLQLYYFGKFVSDVVNLRKTLLKDIKPGEMVYGSSYGIFFVALFNDLFSMGLSILILRIFILV